MRQNVLRLPLFALLVLLLPIAARGAEPTASVKAPPDQAAKPAPGDAGAIVPQRKLQFDVSDEEVPITFDLGDPQLAQQRYAAMFQLQFKLPHWGDGSVRGFMNPWQLGIDVPQRNDQTIRGIIEGRAGYYLLASSWRIVAHEPLQVLASRVPPNRLPPQEVLRELTDKAKIHVRIYFYENSGDDPVTAGMRVTLLAATADQAKQLAQGSIQLIDYGFLAPIHQKYSPILEPVEKKLKESQVGLKEAEEKKAAAEKLLEELKDYADITPESLATLRNQQRMIAVDLAGIKARIEACNKLQAGKVTLARNEQIETVKIVAEIDLIGLSAKRDALEDLIKKGERRVAARREASSAQNSVSSLTRDLRQIEASYKLLKSTFDPQTFFGEVVFLKQEKPAGNEPLKIERLTNTIGIRPIKWVQPDARPASDAPSESAKSPSAPSNPGPSAGTTSPASEEPARRPGGKTPSKGPSRPGR